MTNTTSTKKSENGTMKTQSQEPSIKQQTDIEFSIKAAIDFLQTAKAMLPEITKNPHYKAIVHLTLYEGLQHVKNAHKLTKS